MKIVSKDHNRQNADISGSAIKGVLMRWFLFSLVLLLVGVAYSGEPTPRTTKGIQEPQHQEAKSNSKAETDKRGTDSAPIIVGTIPPSDLNVTTNRNPNEHRDYSSHEWWLVYVTSALAAFTLGLMVFTWRLWNVTGKLARDAKESSERQLRAYLGVSRCGVVTITKDLIQAFIEVKNTGPTPAHKATQTVKAEVRNAADIGNFLPQTTDRGSTVIVPGSHITVRFDLPVTEPIIKEIIAGAKAIFVWGSVTYIDIFEKPQRLDFRYRDLAETYESPDGIESFLTGWELCPEEDGNRST